MTRATTLELDKNKIAQQLASLAEIAAKQSWELDYDEQLDELTFGVELMPEDSFLFNLNQELNLFLTPDSKVSGIFIEYFGRNYIEHNKELKPALKILEEKPAKSKTGKARAEFAMEALENKLLIQALDSLFKRDKLVTAII